MKNLLTALFVIFTACLCVQAKDYDTVCASHILVPTEMDAIKIKNRINSYEDFQFYAKKYSKCPSGQDGGSLGCFGRGMMVKPFEEAAFNGNVGEVSDPIKTQFGYHLIWVTKKY